MSAELHDQADLKMAAHEMRCLAARLEPIAHLQPMVRLEGQPAAEPLDAVAIAEWMLAMRRHRKSLFPAALFGEPAWDILLDLYVAEARDRPISVSSACVAAAVPATTALRWLTTLVEEELVVKERDLPDGRKVYVRLTEPTRQSLTALLTMELTPGKSAFSFADFNSASMIDKP